MMGSDVGHSITAEEKLRVLEDILESETFARAERLKEMLRFLCEAEIEGRAAELTEYSIGTEALGRSKDFAPLTDSCVRSRAWELRQKLEKYYAQEEPSAALRIELRKGTYVPRFRPWQAEADAARTSEIAPVTPTDIVDPGTVARLSTVPPAVGAASSRSPFWHAAVGFTGGAAVMFAAVALWSSMAKPGTRLPATRLQAAAAYSAWTPELETLWRPFIDNDTPLLVAFETRFFVSMGPLVVRDSHVNNLGAVESSEALTRVQHLFGLGQLYASGNYTDVGAPEALFYLTRLLSSRAAPMSVKNSHDISAAELRDSNVILVGKPWLTPQIERVLAAAELVDVSGKILNHRPAPGEQAIYTDRQDKTDPDSWSEKYSVITMMPNPVGGKRILALTTSGSEQPSALAYYLTNPATVRDLVRHLATPSGLLQYYQILVRVDFKGKAVVKVEYVTHRPLTVR